MARKLFPALALVALVLLLTVPATAQTRSCSFVCTPTCPCSTLCWDGFQMLTCASYGICDPNALSAQLSVAEPLSTPMNSQGTETAVLREATDETAARADEE